MTRPLSSSCFVLSFFNSVIIFFPLGFLLFLLELSFLHKSASCHQSNRNAGSRCVLMEAQSQPLLLPKSHSSTFSYTINSISGERGFIKVCFVGVPRQRSPPKRPRARCSDSPVFEKCPQLSTGFSEPSWDRVRSFKHSNLLRPVFHFSRYFEQNKSSRPNKSMKVQIKMSGNDAPKDQMESLHVRSLFTLSFQVIIFWKLLIAEDAFTTSTLTV